MSWRATLARSQWFLIPLILLMCVEAYFRVQRAKAGGWHDDVLGWYDKANAVAEHEPIRFIFVGSSRMAAAIDAEAFAKRMSARYALQGVSLNLGQGYSTLKQHCLGLRNLFRVAPQNLRGCIVFVEMPGNILINEARDSPWAMDQAPGLLASVLSADDVPVLLRSSDPPLRKARCLLGFALRSYPIERLSTLFAFRDRIRKWYLAKGKEALVSALPALSRPAPENANAVDLASVGGIRTWASIVRLSRELAIKSVAAAMQVTESNPPSAYMRNADIVELVRSHGGDVVFLSLPVAPIFEQVEATEVSRENQRVSLELIHQWGVRLVQVRLSLSDDDFPDLWHIRHSLAAEFSRRVVDAFMDSSHAGDTGPEEPALDP